VTFGGGGGHFFSQIAVLMWDLPLNSWCVVCDVRREAADFCMWAGLSAGRAMMKRNNTVDNKEDVCQQVAGGSLMCCATTALRAHCHQVPIVCFAQWKLCHHSDSRTSVPIGPDILNLQIWH
jgi:hypothetical protein